MRKLVSAFLLLATVAVSGGFTHGAQPQGAQIVVGEDDGPTFAWPNLMAFWGIVLGSTTQATFPGYLNADGYPNDGVNPPADMTGVMSFPTADSSYSGQFKMYWPAGASCAWKWPMGSSSSPLTIVSYTGPAPIVASNSTIFYGTGQSVTFKFAQLMGHINSAGFPTPAEVGNGFSYSGCTGMVLCRAQNTPVDDCTTIAGGGLVNPDFVAALNSGNIPPSAIRSITWDGANLTTTSNNFPTQSKYRAALTSVGWTQARWAGPRVWVGPITGTDSYSSNSFTDAPSSWPAFGSDLNPMWQGNFVNTNTSPFPTITITIGGVQETKDLINTVTTSPYVVIGGTSTGGDTLTFAFTYPGGTHNYVYTPASTGLSAVQMAAAIYAGLSADTTLAAANISFDLNNYQSSGAVEIAVNSRYSGTSFTVAVGGSATETMTLTTTMPPGTIKTTTASTLVYSPTLDKVIYASGGILPMVPREARLALSNALGAATWRNYPALWDAASIADEAAYYNANAVAGFWVAYGNECWNFGNDQTTFGVSAGTILGFPNANAERFYGWCGLKSAQLFQTVESAFTRQNGLRTIIENQASAGTIGTQQQFRLNGQDLAVNTYPYLCSFLGGTYAAGSCSGATGFNSYPNRPVDLATTIAYAVYFAGAVTQNGYSSPYGTGDVANCGTPGTNSGGIECAGINFNSGYTTAGLSWLDNDIRQGTKNSVYPSFTLQGFACNQAGSCSTGAQNPANQSTYIQWENVALCYDGSGQGTGNGSSCSNARSTSWPVSGKNLEVTEYEGGPQFTWPTPSICSAMGISVTATVTFNKSSGAGTQAVNWTGSNFYNGETVVFCPAGLSSGACAGSTMPGGVSNGNLYYVQNASANGFDIATTYYNPSVITPSSNGSGTLVGLACQGGIANLTEGFKKSSYGQALVASQFNQFMGRDPTQPTFGLLKHSLLPSQFMLNDSNINQTTPWGLYPGSIYVTPYQFAPGFTGWKR